MTPWRWGRPAHLRRAADFALARARPRRSRRRCARICTEWQEFRSPDFARFKTALKQPVVFDGRNLYEPSLMARQGIRYFAIGRGERL